ncbi:glycosyltransferase [Hydrogenophaga sp. SL48]|jgi:glycosyltransferase involved in cell wall biosynthesis|uniref:glycosyltransferase n=1 Tax=Hydrogenophaga sp. SL48 TaxID=2806347 RepID=UPI001F44F9C1|nr:glycosyltransferase [Hydrogenophaga sp. SL48]UJW82839.1 glycosyltransferase [Hydrogenophaga sp. SL48]
MSLSQHAIVIVMPVYEDLEASGRLFQELGQQFGDRVFVVAVDDGSVRQPLSVESLSQAGVAGAVLKLRRNVGHQRAIAIGLSYAAEHLVPGQQVVVMDSDGEDLPSTIPALLAQLDNPAVDVVVAQRKSRVETFRFKAFYQVYKRFFGVMTGRPISFGNFMALKPAAVKRLVSMQELPIHVAAAVLASKLRTDVCPLDRGPRYAGQSKMNFVGLALHGFKALMVFAEDVLVRVGIASALIATFAVVGSVAAVVLKLMGYSTPGWFSLVLGILVLLFLQTAALALMTLMLTGVMRSGSVVTAVAHRDFIDEILETAP